MDKVAELVKLARKSKDDNSGKKAAAAGAASLAASKGAKGRLLGYHNVYHGTSTANAKSVRKDGELKASKGGAKGGATEGLKDSNPLKDSYRKQVKGKVHVTKSPLHARIFANQAETGKMSLGKGKVLKGKMSHNQYRKAKIDTDVSGTTGNKNIRKAVASTTTHRVKTDGSQKFASKKNMKRYLSTKSGKKRFAIGVGQGIASLGAAVYGSKKLSDKARDRKIVSNNRRN